MMFQPTSTAHRHRSFRIHTALVVLVLVLLVVVAGGGSAALGADPVTVYVDAGSGSDGRSLAEAQSSGTPWQTLNHAVSQVPAGSTIVALSGSFSLSATQSFDPAITIQGESGTVLEAAFSGASGFVVSGFSFPKYTSVSGSSNIVIKNGVSDGGFAIHSGSSYVTVSGMYIHNVDDPNAPPWEKAISLGGSSGAVSNIKILSNRFQANAEDSIQINYGNNVTISGNRFISNGPWNATVDPGKDRHSDVTQILGGSNIVFSNNTVVGNYNVLVVKPHNGRPIGTLTIRNNHFEKNAGFALNIRNVSATVTMESNTYTCNGTAFTSECETPGKYAVSARDTPNLVRINDPAGEGTATTTTTNAPASTTTTTKAPAPATTTTTKPPAATTTTTTTKAPAPATTTTTEASATTTTSSTVAPDTLETSPTSTATPGEDPLTPAVADTSTTTTSTTTTTTVVVDDGSDEDVAAMFVTTVPPTFGAGDSTTEANVVFALMAGFMAVAVTLSVMSIRSAAA